MEHIGKVWLLEDWPVDLLDLFPFSSRFRFLPLVLLAVTAVLLIEAVGFLGTLG
jgi:hypothetical protein